MGTDSLTLLDGKGRPGKPPRPIHLPITAGIRAALDAAQCPGDYVFSTDAGDTHITDITLSNWAKEAAAGAGIFGFETKRIRSGVETLLASVGVGKDTRGRLQSHGIAGVQDTHYDGHDYLQVKRQALDTLFSLLNAKDVSKVKTLRAA